MLKRTRTKSIVRNTIAILWNSGQGQRDVSIFELCATLIADSICPGATGLGPDLHWAIIRDNKVFKVLRKATDDEVIDFVRRVVLASFPLTDICRDLALYNIDLMRMDHEELVDQAMKPFLKDFIDENTTID